MFGSLFFPPFFEKKNLKKYLRMVKPISEKGQYKCSIRESAELNKFFYLNAIPISKGVEFLKNASDTCIIIYNDLTEDEVYSKLNEINAEVRYILFCRNDFNTDEELFSTLKQRFGLSPDDDALIMPNGDIGKLRNIFKIDFTALLKGIVSPWPELTQDGGTATLLNFINSTFQINNPALSFWENIGSAYSGPIVGMYLKYVMNIREANQKVLFVARDGYLLNWAIEKFYPQVDHEYVHLERSMIDKIINNDTYNSFRNYVKSFEAENNLLVDLITSNHTSLKLFKEFSEKKVTACYLIDAFEPHIHHSYYIRKRPRFYFWNVCDLLEFLISSPEPPPDFVDGRICYHSVSKEENIRIESFKFIENGCKKFLKSYKFLLDRLIYLDSRTLVKGVERLGHKESRKSNPLSAIKWSSEPDNSTYKSLIYNRYKIKTYLRIYLSDWKEWKMRKGILSIIQPTDTYE